MRTPLIRNQLRLCDYISLVCVWLGLTPEVFRFGFLFRLLVQNPRLVFSFRILVCFSLFHQIGYLIKLRHQRRPILLYHWQNTNDSVDQQHRWLIGLHAQSSVYSRPNARKCFHQIVFASLLSSNQKYQSYQFQADASRFHSVKCTKISSSFDSKRRIRSD